MSENLLITLGIQDKGTKTQITALNKELRTLDKELKLADKTSGEFESGTEALGRKLDILKSKYDVQQTKLEAYKKRINDTKEQVEKKKQALETLTNSEEANEKQVTKLTKEINKMEQDIRQVAREMNLTETELKALEAEIASTEKTIAAKPFEKMDQELKELGQGIEYAGDKLQALGNGATAVGDTLLKMSAPIVGFGAYAIKASMDYEQAMSEVEAISGATAEELESLEKASKEMGRTTSKSAKESANALKYMALAGWDTKQMLGGLEPVLRLSEAGNIDLARASDLTTDSMSALGVQVKDLNRYLDIVAQSQKKANTSADGLMEAYIGCGGTLKNLNVPLEESATWLGILANRGIKASEAGTGFNSVLVNIMGTSGQAKDALEILGVSAWDADDNFKGIEVTLRELDSALKSCTEAQRNQFTAMIGGKTQMDVLNALLDGLNNEYSDLKASITDSNGALLDMAETMQDNAKGNVTRLKSELEALGIQVGEQLLPHVNEFIASVSDLIKWFGSLDEETQKNIMRMGLFAFAGGTTLKMLGNLTTGVGSVTSGLGRMITNFAESKKKTDNLGSSATGLTGVIAKLAGGGGFGTLLPVVGAVSAGVVALGGAMLTAKTYSTIMGESCITASEDLGVFEKIVNKLTGSTVKSREELEAAGLIAKQFSENVGEEFRGKVQEAEKAINSMTTALVEFNIDNALSESEVTNFSSRVSSLAQGAIDIIKSKQEESQTALKELLMSDGVIDESEQKTLEFLTRQADTQIAQVTATENEIYSIIEQGLANKGYLNEQELEQIKTHLATISQLELQAQATNQDELLEAQANFLVRVRTADVEETSALLAEKASLRDQEINDIQVKYDTQIEMLKMKNQGITEEEYNANQARIAEIESLMTTMDEKTKQAYQLEIDSLKAKNVIISEEERAANEATIASLEQGKAEAITIANEQYDSYLNIIKEHHPEILNSVNELNGEILSNTDKKKTEILNSYKAQYEEINSISKSGMYELKNETTGSLDLVYVTVDSNTKKVTGAWSEAQRKAGGLTKQMSDDAYTMGQAVRSASDIAIAQLESMDKGFVNSKGQITTSNGAIVKSLEEFEKQADGTGRGILDLNGKKISIKTNTRGEIENFKDFKYQLNSIKGSTANSYVNVYYREYNKPAGVGGVGTYSVSSYSLLEPDMSSFTRAMPTTFSLGEYGENIAPMSDVAPLMDSAIWSGGYFSPKSKMSTEFKGSTRAESKVVQQVATNNFDYKEMAKEIAMAVAEALAGVTLRGDAILDTGKVVGEVSNQIAMNVRGRR